MRTLRGWVVMSWVMLPGVMFGGSLLLRRVTTGEPDPFQATWMRAFHAHSGVLIVLSVLYYLFLDRTVLSAGAKHAASLTLFVASVRRLADSCCMPSRGTPVTALKERSLLLPAPH